MKNRLSAGLVLLLLGGVVVAGSWLGAARNLEAWTWPTVQALVLDVSVEAELAGSPATGQQPDPVGYRLYTIYQYQVNGQTYTHRQMGLFYSTQDEANKQRASQAVGTTQAVYYNPDNPQQVLLQRSIVGSLAGIFLGVILCVAGAYWYFLPSLRSKRRSGASSRRSRRKGLWGLFSG